MSPTTLSARPTLNFWGWGYADETLTDAELMLVNQMAGLFPLSGGQHPPPRLADFDLPKPRVAIPGALTHLFSYSDYDRLTHALGKSFADGIRMLLRQVPEPPDYVAFPENEQDIADILAWASDAHVAVVPFGGGTSVCGGVEPAVGSSYAGSVSLDMQRLNQVLEIDKASRCARIQAGIFGPDLEAQLRPHGLTLRHYPQSFQFSTLGGWLATRSGGHFAMGPTHIDEFVQALTVVSPAGVVASRRLPGSGAGPSPDRLMLGSEGILGVITEAWMRLLDRPVHKASQTVVYDSMADAVRAVRDLSQAGLAPSNCRLLDAAEVRLNRVGDGQSPVLIIGFESSHCPVEADMAAAIEIVTGSAGQPLDRGGDAAGGAASQWRNAFIRMPYYRNDLMRRGMILDTFESAVTWDQFDGFYAGVRARLGETLRRITGNDAHLSCRFTHVYPDGPAPYFSVVAAGHEDPASLLSQWQEFKREATAAVVDLGGTVTHHHAVGRDHRPGYQRQAPALFQHVLASAKQQLDPQAILNPGVLIDPADQPLGVTGAMAQT